MHSAPGREEAEDIAPRVLDAAGPRYVNLDDVVAGLKRHALRAPQKVD